MIRIGTSGWQYEHWKNVVYPADAPKKDWLKIYLSRFDTVEINTSFYNLTKRETYEKWKRQVPKNFLFSAKLFRYITHRKRLIIDEKSAAILKINLKNLEVLDKNLGAVLIQLPPNFKFNIERLETFLKKLSALAKSIYCARGVSASRCKKQPKFSIEFRHQSWFNQETYNLLKKYKIGWCISESPNWKTQIIKTTNWAYIRMHGSSRLFTSLYSEKELKKWVKEIKKLNAKEIFIYFNNDWEGNAVKNADYLKKVLNPVMK